MARTRVLKTNFTAGEFSPRLLGRSDLERYANGAAEMLNVTVFPQGGMTRRTGSYFIAVANTVRLRHFVAGVDSAYVLAFGNGFVQFYRNRGTLMNGAIPFVLAAPWGLADLPGLRFEQSNDVMFVTHPNYQPRLLMRTAENTFTLKLADFIDGPYQTENTGTVGDPASAGVSGTSTGTGQGAAATSAGGSSAPDGGGGGAGGGDGAGGGGE